MLSTQVVSLSESLKKFFLSDLSLGTYTTVSFRKLSFFEAVIVLLFLEAQLVIKSISVAYRLIFMK